MDDPTKWTESSLNALIQNVVKESLTLDYKAAAAVTPKTDGIKNEISKDVSAFANSAGGTIVYGMTEVGHQPTAIEGIDPTHVSREWLDQVIASRIQRRIDDVRINQVGLADGKVVYVVVIPQSQRAPHMASDHRFYKRFEFHSVAMEEYEVRDISNRAGGPRVGVTLSIKPVILEYGSDSYSQPVQIRGHLFNDSAIPAEYAVFHLAADGRLNGVPGGFTNKREISLSIGGATPTMHLLWQLNWSIPAKLPIWNGMSFNLFDPSYEIRIPRSKSQFLIGWSAKAPRMMKVSEAYLLVVGADGVPQLSSFGTLPV